MRLTELLESIDLDTPRQGDQLIIDLPDGTSVLGLISEASSSYMIVDLNRAERLVEAMSKQYYDAELTIANPNFDASVEDENDPRYAEEIDVGVNYSISGSYRPATWGYHGGEPEEHPEMEITDVVDLATGKDISDRVDMSDLEQRLWDHAEANKDDDFDPPDDYYEGVNEAEYAGRKVQLGKPKRGGSKKFYVYVRNPKTKRIVKVQFGDTTGLSIKRHSTKHRKSFRARHNCSNPGPRTKARYWSCRMWSSKPVGKIVKGK